jgi:hypothetical protein
MAESLTGMAEVLRWKSLLGNSQDKFNGHWNQCRQWCQIIDAGCAAAQGIVH